MNTPLQETLAQVFFWTGLGSLPAGIVTLVLGCKASHDKKALGLLAAGGILLTHCAWYCVYLGTGLANTHGTAHPPAWWMFSPLGLGVFGLLAAARRVIRKFTSRRQPPRLPPALPRS